jgi:hypothetical protein
MGEAFGTKGVTLESTTRVSFVKEGASDLEYQGEFSVLVSAGFEDGVSGGHLDGTGDDSPIRDSLEVLPQAVLPMKLTMVEVDQSREVWGVESSSLNSKGPSVEEDVVPLHLVTYLFDNDCAMKELTTESYMLEEPWKRGLMPRSLFLDNVKQYMSGEYQSPLSCVPLDRLDPIDFYVFTQNYTGDAFSLEEVMSVWVEQKYKGFSKLVGMAMKGFENECISLLRRIDTERKRMRQMTCPRGPTEMAKKGKRELRNLISSVNYEGRKVTNACT